MSGISEIEQGLDMSARGHAGADEPTESFARTPPAVHPKGKRRRNIPAPAGIPSAAGPVMLDAPTGMESLDAMLPHLLTAGGLLLLGILLAAIGLTAPAASCLLALLMFAGWRYASWDWIPAGTIRRTIGDRYGLAVPVIDDMSDPWKGPRPAGRRIRRGRRYRVEYADGDGMLREGTLMVWGESLLLVRPDGGIIPAREAGR